MKYTLFDENGQELSPLKCQLSEIAVILDTQTELYWEAKSFDTKSDRFFERQMTWDEFSNDYISYLNEISYGGYNDWRVPTKHELRSLISYRQINPAFSQADFRSLTTGDYWCGPTYGRRADCGWVINFNIGSTTAKNKTLPSYGVAVRGKKMPPARERFVDNGDGTITDTYLKLMWQKDQDERKSYNQILEMLPNYELAGHRDWRLPTMHELSSIFDADYENQSWYFDEFFKHDALKPPILQHITSNLFENTYVWVINFNFGYDGYYGEKFIPLAYRLVRNLNDESNVFKIPPSGQKEIYSASGAVTGIDISHTATSYGEIDEYIWDMKTGLMYEKASARSYTFEEAEEHIKKLNASFYGGTNNWRLPTVDELRFIVDYSKKNPAVFDKFAPYVKADFYWTIDQHAASNYQRNWAIYFGYGCAVPIEKNYRCGCMAVSGGYVNLADKSKSRYEVKDGVVLDKFTRLMWLQDELPPMTYSDFEKYLAENELAGYKDWRIPDIKELSTITIRDAKNNEWFDRELFPNIFENKSFFITRETFNGMFNWGINMNFAYDGYYADRLNGVYKIKPVRNI